MICFTIVIYDTNDKGILKRNVKLLPEGLKFLGIDELVNGIWFGCEDNNIFRPGTYKFWFGKK